MVSASVASVEESYAALLVRLVGGTPRVEDLPDLKPSPHVVEANPLTNAMQESHHDAYVDQPSPEDPDLTEGAPGALSDLRDRMPELAALVEELQADPSYGFLQEDDQSTVHWKHFDDRVTPTLLKEIQEDPSFDIVPWEDFTKRYPRALQSLGISWEWHWESQTGRYVIVPCDLLCDPTQAESANDGEDNQFDPVAQVTEDALYKVAAIGCGVVVIVVGALCKKYCKCKCCDHRCWTCPCDCDCCQHPTQGEEKSDANSFCDPVGTPQTNANSEGTPQPSPSDKPLDWL